jgi:hypothetical protein
MGDRVLIGFVHTYRCPICAHREYGVLVGQVRINKRSLVTGPKSLAVMPWQCRECGARLADRHDRVDIDPADLVRVNAYRVRRGWEPIGAS